MWLSGICFQWAERQTSALNTPKQKQSHAVDLLELEKNIYVNVRLLECGRSLTQELIGMHWLGEWGRTLNKDRQGLP